jgi:hypothetical protein
MSTDNVEEGVTPDSENKEIIKLTTPDQKSWTLPFLGYGALAGLPIPCIGWLWLILGISAASKLGWAKGLMGIGIFFGTAIITRVVLMLILSGFSGN